jgi:hypothetical protein
MDAIMRKKMKQQIHGTRETLSAPGMTTWMNCPAVGVEPNNPFTSEKQRRFLWAKKPKVAKEFAAKTPKGTKLPMRVKK